MDYKQIYTLEEIESLVAWFEERKSQLPQTLSFLPGISTQDLPTLVDKYITLARHHAQNATYGGQIYHLFCIREALIQQGVVQ